MSFRSDVRVVRATARKDLQLALTQRMLLVIGVLLPVNFLVLFMLFALNGGQAPTAVVMEDHGPLAQKFLTAMRGAHSFQITEMDGASASRLIAAGKIVAVVTVPSTFDSDLDAGRPVELPVTVNNLQTDFTNDIRRAIPLTVTAFYADAYPGHVSVQANEVDLHRADTGYIPYLAVSVAVLSLLIAGILQGAFSAAREHDSATLIAIALSPASRWAIVTGKLLAALLVNSVSGLLVVVVVVLLIGSMPVHPLQIAGIAMLLMTAFASLGILLGNIVRTRRAAIPLSIAIAMPLFFLSGPFGPPNWLGPVQAVLAHLSPAYYGIAAFQYGFHGFETAQTSLALDLVVLAGLAVLAAALSTLTLKPRRAT